MYFEMNGFKGVFDEQCLILFVGMLKLRLVIATSVAGVGVGGLPKIPAFGVPSPLYSDFQCLLAAQTAFCCEL